MDGAVFLKLNFTARKGEQYEHTKKGISTPSVGERGLD